MKKKSVNAMEVARLAKVSQSTVSRVFTPGSNVSEKTKRKVLEVARELGYRPNALARGLIMNKTNIVGLAMRDIENPFYHEVLGKFTKGLRDRGYHVLFVYTENDEIQQEEITQFLEYSVEGVIVTDAYLSSKVVSQLHENNIPVILFNRYSKDIPCYSVSCDNYAAAQQIARYLHEQGYQNMAFITGRENTSTSQDRQRGFCDFLQGVGMAPIIEKGDFTYEKAYEATLRMLAREVRPDAIFGANDITALGALDAVKAKGLSVPDDIAIVGFDNIKMTSWPSHELTTWEQPVDEMIELTIDTLLNDMKMGSVEPASKLVSGQLIERRTTKKKI
ncbi:LacI family DNA-binding transcriptional regulator [Brevibacillus choshinensis]|uniref:LacI family DNA-binding transcriptional regulator n=1 Tax=Brevibacillus choshinensis TaxID=54911 RepID=A0ABX7FNC5_BRECH|nr:LacI family DNA-binding transcriptional regulator [Brevibacillus choshinensis]QRG67167.1 LacI family DNA-binding transcriptional regulator [Brevibacillus choshinensis]